jgi:hypothetical protein
MPVTFNLFTPEILLLLLFCFRLWKLLFLFPVPSSSLILSHAFLHVARYSHKAILPLFLHKIIIIIFIIMLQAGRWRVRVPMRSFDFFFPIYVIPPNTLGPGVYSPSNRNECQTHKMFLGSRAYM